jgi:hypothetical protein
VYTAGRTVEPGIVEVVAALRVRPAASAVVVLVRVADPDVSTVLTGASQVLYPLVSEDGSVVAPAGRAVPASATGSAAGPTAHGRPAHSGLLSHRESVAAPSAV